MDQIPSEMASPPVEVEVEEENAYSGEGALDEGSNLPADLCTVPAHCLNLSTRNYLARRLDVLTPSMTSNHLSRDWRGVAQLLGFSYLEMRELNGMMSLLDAWTTQQGATLDMLCAAFETLNRGDILNDPCFISDIERDMCQHLEKEKAKLEQKRREQMAPQKPVQVNEVSSLDDEKQLGARDNTVPITTEDMSNGVRSYYDAFIIATDSDMPFVREMIRNLEGVHGYRLFLKHRNLLSNLSYHQSIVKLLQQRCTKVIVVLSPEFHRDPDCRFEMEQAFALCPGMLQNLIIPILCKPCATPDLLRTICPLDYTKSIFITWFWNRLNLSLQDRVLVNEDRYLLPPRVMHRGTASAEEVPSEEPADIPSSITAPHALHSSSPVPSGSASASSHSEVLPVMSTTKTSSSSLMRRFRSNWKQNR